ncbi:Lrp/AsnC family transcriptional regulator [Thermococcus sp.]
MAGIDEKDEEILRLLRKNGRMTLTEIGRRVGLSPASVKKRLEKLERVGAIRGYSAVVDHSFLGRLVKILFLLRLKVEGPEIDRLVLRLAERENVQSVYRISGRAQIAIIAEFKDMKGMRSFAGSIKGIFGDTLEYIEWGVIYETPKECWVQWRG